MAAFQKNPCITVETSATVSVGWDRIILRLDEALQTIPARKKIIVVEYYQGIDEDDVTERLAAGLHPDLLITAGSLYKDPAAIREMVHADVTDDRLFGYLTRLEIDAYFDPKKLAAARQAIEAAGRGTVLITGTGAARISSGFDLLVYADMARWEIQQRMRRREVSNIGCENKDVQDWMLLVKQGYFVDWRVCDRNKKSLMHRWDFVLDTNDSRVPKLVDGAAVREGLHQALTQPFSVVPFFDPGPWGGQWMKEVCGLDPSVSNYAWCFNCVPEENSLCLNIGGTVVELPAIDLVFFSPQQLLGDEVHARFGDEFPIRFDFLDTMGGGNLSLQVHPITEYIREKFGIPYTQDESYYIMDAKEGAVVYLGLRDGIQPGAMMRELESAQSGGQEFDAQKFVQTWPAKKHDHFLVPGGTVHCSGKDSMVLEISATPYIFTFKLWDWGRLGLDGRPRPINIEHGRNVIQWERTAAWTAKNLIGRVETIGQGDGWVEERTGLHEREFIETRRHRFTKKVHHATNGGVNVLCLVDGKEAVVESPAHAFKPFVVHYAETFIVPACIGEYSIAPVREFEECVTIKAYVRTRA
jgi:mannose-6-phosphate isomerase class I